jgi:hypothetical protein
MFVTEIDKTFYIDTEGDTKPDLLIGLDGINHKNSHFVAEQAWEFLGLNSGLNPLVPAIIRERVKLLLDPNRYSSQAYSTLHNECRELTAQTGNRKWTLLGMGFAALALKGYGLNVTRVYGKQSK